MKDKTVVLSIKIKPANDQLDALLEDLSPSDRELIVAENKAVVTARAQGGVGELALGQHLQIIQQKLEPKGKWQAYIKTLPNLTQPTAYRKIWKWMNAQRLLPGATLQVAVAEGYKLISDRKGEDYSGHYGAAVRKVTRELGPPPAEGLAEARAWLQAVVKAKRELAKRATRPHRDEPVSVLRKRLEIRCVGMLKTSLERLPADARKDFAQRFVGIVVNLADLPKSHIESIPIPREIGPLAMPAAA